VRERMTRIGVAALAAALLLSACSESVKDDGKASGGGGRQPATRTMRGVTDTSIKVGGLVYDLYFGDARVGVEARIKEANDAGGVHGRKIEVVTAENDNNDPAKGLEITKRLVESEKVFALLPVLSGSFGGGDYAARNAIPTFGWGTSPGFCDQENAFGVTGCVTNPSLKVASNALGTAFEKHFGGAGKTIAFLGEDNDAGRGGIKLLVSSVEDKGFEVVMADASLPAPPDVMGDESPFIAKLLKSDGGGAPDIVYLIATLSGTKLSSALQAAGYKGMIVTPSYSPLLLGVPGYDGTWINTQIAMDPTVPANAEMLRAVTAVKPDQKLNLAVSVGYWAADMFVKGLEKAGRDLTVERFLAALNGGGFTYEVPEVVGRSEWPGNHGHPVPCGALTQVKGKEFVPSLPLTCGTNIPVK